MREAIQKKCPECNTDFSCHTDGCWCSDYPTILPLDSSASCLCKKCLSAHLQGVINWYMADLTPEKIKKVQALGKPSQAKEGIDYNIEGGAWVFSGWYLLRQGSCCGNGCRNCPYPFALKK